MLESLSNTLYESIIMFANSVRYLFQRKRESFLDN